MKTKECPSYLCYYTYKLRKQWNKKKENILIIFYYYVIIILLYTKLQIYKKTDNGQRKGGTDRRTGGQTDKQL